GGAQRRFQHRLVEGVAAGDDHYEVLRTWGQSTQRVLLQIGAAHVRGAREALAPGEVRTVVHDHSAAPRYRSHVRDELAHVYRSIEDESRGRPYHVDEAAHLAAALHAQVLAGGRHGRKRPGRFARGGQG